MTYVPPARAQSALLTAGEWVQNMLLGPVGTGVAVLAIATIGFMMLDVTP